MIEQICIFKISLWQHCRGVGKRLLRGRKTKTRFQVRENEGWALLGEIQGWRWEVWNGEYRRNVRHPSLVPGLGNWVERVPQTKKIEEMQKQVWEGDPKIPVLDKQSLRCVCNIQAIGYTDLNSEEKSLRWNFSFGKHQLWEQYEGQG